MSAATEAPAAQTRARPWLGRRLALPAALFCLTLLAYLTTLTQVHTFDALSYVTSVERKPWTEVFHPHHLAYGPLGTLALTAGRAIGYAGGAALPMQLVNAAAGALGVALFFAVVRRATGRTDVALAAALLLGGAYAYWYYAVEIEVYTVATLFLIVCLGLMARPELWRSPRLLLALGLAQGGAILFHQTNVLLCAPVATMFLISQVAGRRSQVAGQDRRCVTCDLRRGAWYAITLALTVGLPYLFVGVVVSGFRSWGEFSAWLTEYARTGWWGGPITAQKWAGLGKGLSETLAQPGGALLWLLLAALLLVHVRRLAAAPRPLLAALAVWLLVYGGFFLWWEPDNVEFWIASLPPALLLLALALPGARPWGPGVWLALAVAATAIGVNHDSIARRGDAANDLQRVIARELKARSAPSDLLLVPDGLLELYLPYYQGHDNFLSLNQALFD
ncbi:MAG TPA: glycosyltransferase family 39 protein, partial [Roseiflexaceae bacterium]